MFVIGVIKYGERTWALRCGNIETIRNSLKKEPRTKCHFYLEDRPRQRSFKVAEADEDEYLVRRAHALFHICKLAVVDDYSVDEVGDTRDGNTFRHLTNEEKYAVMGMELSFMYDILYTKAGVIHTRRGYCIRVISPLATAGALLIFQFSGKAGDIAAESTRVKLDAQLPVYHTMELASARSSVQWKMGSVSSHNYISSPHFQHYGNQ
uniref:DUF4220 domain-containing protein n=1 Tax=Oryza glumipatula TaxID=40148 RepID=A0A0D9ZGU2_9ORYZ